MTTESDIEKECIKQIHDLGGWCIKYTSSSERGLPDRLCIFPNGKIVWVEFKRPRRFKLDPLQKIQVKRLKKLHQTAIMINSFSKITNLIDYAIEKGWFNE